MHTSESYFGRPINFHKKKKKGEINIKSKLRKIKNRIRYILLTANGITDF